MDERQIYNYLEGNMSAEERTAFERKMDNDPELRQTIKLYNGIDKMMQKSEDEEEIIHFVKEIREEYENKTSNLQHPKWIGIAASLIILIGVFSLFTYINKQNQILFSRYFSVWQIDNQSRSKFNLHENWIDYYEKGDYELFVYSYEKLDAKLASNPQIMLMYASALIELDKYNKAYDALKNFNMEGYKIFEPDFLWYNGLCLIMLDREKEAVKNFERLVNNSFYGEQSQHILKRIN